MYYPVLTLLSCYVIPGGGVANLTYITCYVITYHISGDHVTIML